MERDVVVVVRAWSTEGLSLGVRGGEDRKNRNRALDWKEIMSTSGKWGLYERNCSVPYSHFHL